MKRILVRTAVFRRFSGHCLNQFQCLLKLKGDGLILTPKLFNMTFQDHFSRQSDIYLKARPTYPDDLFQFLASISPGRELCWDCATGNGQAAISLAQHFQKVIATDASRSQIQNAITADNIEYRLATAEESGLAGHSVDLITVATAAHWFEHDKFYKEAQRVSKANGVLAVWTYSEAIITTEIDAILSWFMYDLLLNYWPDGRWYVRNRYETLPFPFKMLETPDFYCRMNWTKVQFLNYAKSWSSYNNYVQRHNEDPLRFLLPKLDVSWNDTEVKPVVWKLHLKCARLNEQK